MIDILVNVGLVALVVVLVGLAILVVGAIALVVTESLANKRHRETT